MLIYVTQLSTNTKSMAQNVDKSGTITTKNKYIKQRSQKISAIGKSALRVRMIETESHCTFQSKSEKSVVT